MSGHPGANAITDAESGSPFVHEKYFSTFRVALS